jgi:hypothetical protein
MGNLSLHVNGEGDFRELLMSHHVPLREEQEISDHAQQENVIRLDMEAVLDEYTY